MTLGNDSPFEDDSFSDFEDRASSGMRNAALANAVGIGIGGVSALGVGWYVYGALAFDPLITLAVAVILGLIVGAVVANVAVLILGAFVLSAFFGGGSE